MWPLIRTVPLLAVCAAVLNAQEPPLIRSSTRLVQVSAIVLSKDRKPVADLKAEDFSISERGRPQEIAFFSIEKKRIGGERIQLTRGCFPTAPPYVAAIPRPA